MHDCPDCRDDLDHCHETLVVHDGSLSCDGCDHPSRVTHTTVALCDERCCSAAPGAIPSATPLAAAA